MLLKPLAMLRTDWTTELRPSRNELVDPLFHQFKIPSRSFLRVLATLFISATAECAIHEQRRSGALPADFLSAHEYTSCSASAIWQARASLRWVFAGSSSSLLASWRFVSDSFFFSHRYFVWASCLVLLRRLAPLCAPYRVCRPHQELHHMEPVPRSVRPGASLPPPSEYALSHVARDL